MRAVALAVASVLVLLAGCSSPQPPAPAAPEMAEPAPEWRHYDGTFELTRTEAQTLAGRTGLDSDNCIMFDKHALITGTATVTWSPSPGTPEMELVLSGKDGVVFGSGDGEAKVEFHDFAVQHKRVGGSPLAWQVAPSMPAGVANDLHGTLVVSLDYLLDDPEGEFNPEPGWGCSIGH